MAAKPVDHLAAAQGILNQQPDDIGDYDIARATAHAVVAATEQLGTIAQLIRDRNAPPTLDVRHKGIQQL